MKKDRKIIKDKIFIIFIISMITIMSYNLIVKAVDNEKDFSRMVYISLDGGSCNTMYWQTMVDDTGNGYTSGG